MRPGFFALALLAAVGGCHSQCESDIRGDHQPLFCCVVESKDGWPHWVDKRYCHSPAFLPFVQSVIDEIAKERMAMVRGVDCRVPLAVIHHGLAPELKDRILSVCCSGPEPSSGCRYQGPDDPWPASR